MLRVAVCEDKDEDLALLRTMLHQTEVPFDLCEYTNAENLVWDVETGRKQFDICLLDICLPGLSGVEAARHIRAVNENAVLIFLSASEDFYREAFDVYAFHYLIKPLKREEFAGVLQKAVQSLRRRQEECLRITTRGRDAILRYADIASISSTNHILCLKLCDGQEYTVYGKLDEFAAQLKSDLFIRCHKSFIVNLLHVRELTPKGFRMADAIIPISRSYAAAAKERYHRHLFGIFEEQ